MFVASLISTRNKSFLASLRPNALILAAKARIAMTRAGTPVSSVTAATGRSWSAGAHAAASRGAFILFEGGDRCGKTTQSQLLLENLQLQHCAVELWKFPDRKTQTGQMIDKYLAGTQDASDGTIHLLFSANRWEKEAALKAKLYSGVTIIADRYAFSGAAYTAAKRNPQHSLDWCKAPDRNLPAPDLVFFLDAPARLAQQRSDFGAERYEQAEFQAEVMRVFRQLKDESWLELDASRSISDLETDVLEAAQKVVQACREGIKPLRRLWDRMPLGADTLCDAG